MHFRETRVPDTSRLCGGGKGRPATSQHLGMPVLAPTSENGSGS